MDNVWWIRLPQYNAKDYVLVYDSEELKDGYFAVITSYGKKAFYDGWKQGKAYANKSITKWIILAALGGVGLGISGWCLYHTIKEAKNESADIRKKA